MARDITNYRSLLSSLNGDPFVGGADEDPNGRPFEGDSIFASTRQKAVPVVKAPIVNEPVVVPAAPPVVDARPQESQRVIEVPGVKDPVLRLLLQAGTLRPEHMATLFPQIQALQPGMQLWRKALELNGVPPEPVFEAAARAYGVPGVDLNRIPRSMLVTTLTRLPLEFRKQCHTLRLLPFAFEQKDQDGEITLKMATYDPVRKEVLAFLRDTRSDIHLYYAPVSMLNATIRSLKAHPTPA